MYISIFIAAQGEMQYTQCLVVSRNIQKINIWFLQIQPRIT